MMTDWYERTIKALQLNGKGERTQECYARAMHMLSEFFEKTPDLVSEEELQKYFLHRKNVNKWAPNSAFLYCNPGRHIFFKQTCPEFLRQAIWGGFRDNGFFICQGFDLLFGVLPTWHQREGIGPVFRYIPAFSLEGHQAR